MPSVTSTGGATAQAGDSTELPSETVDWAVTALLVFSDDFGVVLADRRQSAQTG